MPPTHRPTRLAPDVLPTFVDWVQARREQNQDTYVAVTGPEGWGKSSLGLQAALAADPDLSPGDVILDRDDYYRVYDPDATDQVYVFDEAARLLFNRNWNNRHQRALVQEVIENRQNRNLVFLHIPRFKILDKYAREGRIALWFACTAQGVAMVRRLDYDAYQEEARYPIVVDEHRWLPLEQTHPDFAATYYDRKRDAHSSKFHERRRQNLDQDASEAAEEAHKEAKRARVLSRKDSDE